MRAAKQISNREGKGADGMLYRILASLMLVAAFGLAPVAAQKSSQKQSEGGGLKGRVRVAAGTSAGVSVTLRQNEREVAQTVTNSKGEFELRGIAPGLYGLTFRKAGLSTGRMEGVEVRAGKVRTLDKLFMTIDEGSIAHLRGSVFDERGLSLGNVEIELALILPDGSLKKLEERVASGLGNFAFQLSPEPARYRVTAKAEGRQTATQDVTIDSAAIFRVALTLNPK
jgi:hypothetical protein